MTERRERTYPPVIAVLRTVFRLLDLQVEVRGAEHIPASGPAVLACNHVGYLDFALVGLAARRRDRLVRFLAKAGTFRNPVSGPLMRGMHHIPVERGDALAGSPAYRRAIRELQAGELVGVFPESTISRSWTLRPFKPGAAGLAVREQVPLVPLVTWGAHRVLSTDGHVHPTRHVPVLVIVGAPILPTPSSTRDGVETLLQATMQDLLDTAQRNYPVDGAGRWWQPLHLDGTAPTRGEAEVLELEVDRRRTQPRPSRRVRRAG